MKAMPSFALLFLACASSVSAHGYVNQLGVDGTFYIGNAPTQDGLSTNASVIRRISMINPVKGASNPSVNCGNNATTPGSLVAQANPGSALTIHWEGSDTSKWPHNTGPMLTYMASCGDSSCDEFDSSTAKWFKINEQGFDTDNSTWLLARLMTGVPANVTLPSNIAPGNYLLRHEIIALHLGMTQGGAEFYPSCSQLTIGGSGTGTPTSSELVSLPGAYSDTDPGILVSNIYDGIGPANYTFPGPPVAAFAASSSGGGDGAGYGTGTADSPSSLPTGGSTGQAALAGKCRLKKRQMQAVQRRSFNQALRRLLGYEPRS